MSYLRQVGGRDEDGVDDPMELDFSRAVALDSDQRLYVCDTRDYQIQVFERDGTPAGAFGEFGRTWTVSITRLPWRSIADDDVHIVDQGHFRVQVFDPSGRHLRSYGEYGAAVGQFLLPRSIAIDRGGRSYVADAAAFRIVVFESDGRADRRDRGALRRPAPRVAPPPDLDAGRATLCDGRTDVDDVTSVAPQRVSP